MRKSLQLSIPKPCNEKWESFTPTSNGGFCAGCSKEVLDFTKWDEERIKAYFKNCPANTCGRFRQDQLRVYALHSGVARKRQNLVAALFLSIITLFLSKQAVAQVRNSAKGEVVCPQPWEEVKRPVFAHSDRTVVRGVVRFADDNSPLPGVNVIRKGSTQGTVTDAEGKFDLTIDNPGQNETLVFAFVGMKTVERSFSPAAEHEVNVVMENDITTLGGVVTGGVSLRRISFRRWWWKVKNLF